LLAGQRGGFSNMQRLFALTMIELWRREYRITNAAAASPRKQELEPVP
jgi:hypothetical protein